MRIVIFGGTTEGRALSERLAQAGAAVTVCVATDYGGETQGAVPGVETRIGPLSAAEKRALLGDAALCVDATHPYARHVSASVKAACAESAVRYLRLLRASSDTGDALVFESAAAAADWLRDRPGRVLLTTGAKELAAFAPLGPERLIARVLPSHEGLAACEALGIPHRNIVAMQGPFTGELNAALIRQYGAAFVVSKDGGAAGGFPEKLAAARQTGARLLVLRRPQEDGLPFDAALQICLEAIKSRY